MTISITYQELQQLIADKLHKNVELQATSNKALKIVMHNEFMNKKQLKSRITSTVQKNVVLLQCIIKS